MSTPSQCSEGAAQHLAAGPGDVDADSVTDIPRRLMRVKVLYTFDDENKSNCLVRLPNALNIPTVSLDETTQVGVVELKTCIQAIVSASPELVTKLGHDYTVYAYDYSEYETPLVGQGMLSWILASASATPNAPAEESQTMVTGRVCKNILGLFSNGVKETLEVKLKLVPVPTCMQREYVESMERYHNLNKPMPEGPLNPDAWDDFLKANPAIRQLAQPVPTDPTPAAERSFTGGVEPFHEMLTRPSPSGELVRSDSFCEQSRMTYNEHNSRASSPALSVTSQYPYSYNQDSRPASRLSFREEPLDQNLQYPNPGQDLQDEGPPKKRARITKAKRPKKTALGINNESLRVTASTAASVRLHKPVAGNASAAIMAEQIPRAPTPRPGDTMRPLLHGPLRPPAPSLLRHASVDQGRPYMSPYEASSFSDTAGSPDDERATSPGYTPLYIPSSPPVMPQRVASPAPSSPELPLLHFPNDSGFASDIPSGRDEEEVGAMDRWPRMNSASTPLDPAMRAPLDTSKRPHSQPDLGPVEKAQGAADLPRNPRREQVLGPSPQPESTAASPDTGFSPTATNDQIGRTSQNAISRTGTPHPPEHSGTAKARALTRCHTWAGGPHSDASVPAEISSKQPRSGSGAQRRHRIRERLDQALTAGQMPTYCNNCGQIDTPVWRKAYTRIEHGTPENIELSSKGTGITAFEAMEPAEDVDGLPKYRIFKQALDSEEMEAQTFTTLTLCNPCGLWLAKKNAMRPPQVWAKAQAANDSDKPKRKRDRRRKTKVEIDETMSDAVVPDSELVMPDTQEEEAVPARPLRDVSADAIDMGNLPTLRNRSSSFQAAESSQFDQVAAQAALIRAIQSSPVGLRGSKGSPIEIESDLTPKPTRRLLFPSPRKPGEIKSLTDDDSSQSPTRQLRDPKAVETKARLPELDVEDIDKENCPPTIEGEDDSLAHLFEERVSPKTTPTKSRALEDLLKTPTPASRGRNPLTPKRGATVLSSRTPSRVTKTPRSDRKAASVAPETPFTRQLNALLSDCVTSSPSQALDFSAFPMFNTPGRSNDGGHFDFLPMDDFLSSDLPIPSSPSGALPFSVFEDPNTSTVGLWSGASFFEGSDAIGPDVVAGEKEETVGEDSPERPLSKMHGISVDFAAMIEEVVGNPDKSAGNKSPEHQGKTVGERTQCHDRQEGDGKKIRDVPP